MAARKRAPLDELATATLTLSARLEVATANVKALRAALKTQLAHRRKGYMAGEELRELWAADALLAETETR